MKSLFISLFCIFGVTAGPAMACDMSLEARSDQVADFVTNGVACLETPPGTYRFDVAVEEAFEGLINAAREEAGLETLGIRRELQPAARFHSLDMGINAFFAHRAPDGRRAGHRTAAFDRTLLTQSLAENIAKYGPAECFDQNNKQVSCFEAPGFKLPSPGEIAADLHQRLMESEGHRENILAESNTHMAIGVARSDTGFFVTQLFANQVGELREPLPTQLTGRQKLAFAVDIDGWDFDEFSAMRASGKGMILRRNRLPNLMIDAATLIVNVERTRREKSSTLMERLGLSGPSFTLVAATES